MTTINGTIVLLGLCFIVGLSNCYAVSESVGSIKSVIGEAYILTPQGNVRVHKNMKVFAGDALKTGSQSGVGIIFEDDTVVSLGSDSKMKIEDFIFDPGERELSFVARLIRGTFSFITGQIAKLAPTKIKIETPDATLGIRGTKFLVKIDSSQQQNKKK